MSATPVFVGSIKNLAARVQNAQGVANVSLIAAAANGSRIRSLMASSDDTVARTFQLVATISGTDYPLGQFTVPIGAGTGTTTPLNLLDETLFPWLQNDGLRNFIDLASGTTLQARALVAVTSGKTVSIFGEYGDV